MNQIKVGSGGLIFDGDKVLLAKRKGSHGEGKWGSFGGHVEFGESPTEAAIREAKEELDIIVGELEYLYTADFQTEGKHFIDLGFKAKIISGEPKIMESHKVECIEWFDFDNLPANLFEPIQYCVRSIREGMNYFEKTKA